MTNPEFREPELPDPETNHGTVTLDVSGKESDDVEYETRAYPLSPSAADLNSRLSAMEARLDVVPREATTTDEKLEMLALRIEQLQERIDALTAAVNQFGAMLQHIVNTVSMAGQAIQSKGIGGLMGLMGGGSQND